MTTETRDSVIIAARAFCIAVVVSLAILSFIGVFI